MDHPLEDPTDDDGIDPPPTGGQPPSPREDDWHRHTLRPPHQPSSPAPHNPQPQQQQQRYESLTGLLHRTGNSPAYGVEDDDESYRHMSVDDGSVLSDANGERGESRRGGGRCRFMGCSCRYDSPPAVLLGITGIGMLGTVLGLTFPSSDNGDDASPSTSRWDVVSSILGYTYFLAWTLSFYPQIITNFQYPAKARRGVSLDFVVWNIVGFSCYAIYTTSFRYSVVVRREYAERFGGDDDGSSQTNRDGLVDAASDVLLRFLSSGADSIDGVELPNPFDWTWSDGDSTADDPSSPSNATKADDGSDGDAVAAPQVKANDVAFAWHALMLTIITFVQIVWCSDRGRMNRRSDAGWVEAGGGMEGIVADSEHERVGFTGLSVGEESDFVGSGGPAAGRVAGENDLLQKEDRERTERERAEPPPPVPTSRGDARRVSSTTKLLILLLLSMCVAGAIMVACDVEVGYWGGGGRWQWLDYLYFLSFVKVGVSIVKYIPQVVLNFRRKSTSGWQIWNIILDFSGGTLSIVQLVGDSMAEARAQGLPHSWTGVLGNPAKFGLGLVSIFFDVIFLFQHYVLYRHSTSSRHCGDEHDDAYPSSDYETPLLRDE